MSKRYIITDERDDIDPCFNCGCKDIEVIDAATLKCFNCGSRGADWFFNLERSIPDWNSIPRRSDCELLQKQLDELNSDLLEQFGN